jgi:hypothetical protein
MATQRAILQTLGPKIIPFRDRVETWVTELAGDPLPNVVAPGVSIDTIAAGPGVYLRARLSQARSVASLRAAATRSLRDGFTSCMFVRKEETQGPPCKSPSDCSGGLLCNDWSICARPSQPYNMRLLYRSLRVLSPEWADELHRASTDLAVRAFELDLDAVKRNDVPVSVEILSRARYFTAVLDEEPQGGLPPALARSKEERAETDEERIQRAPHAARVGIWDVRSGHLLVRVRTEAAAEFVPVGVGATTDPETLAAEKRQVNSCAIALDVKEAIAAAPAAAAPPQPAAP